MAKIMLYIMMAGTAINVHSDIISTDMATIGLFIAWSGIAISDSIDKKVK